MEFKIKTFGYDTPKIVELEIKSSSATIVEDVAEIGGEIPSELIENLEDVCESLREQNHKVSGSDERFIPMYDLIESMYETLKESLDRISELILDEDLTDEKLRDAFEGMLPQIHDELSDMINKYDSQVYTNKDY